MIVLAVVVVVLATPLYFVVVLDDDDSEDDDDVIGDGDVDAFISAAAAAEVTDVCPWIIMMTIVEMPAVSSELLLMLLLYT